MYQYSSQPKRNAVKCSSLRGGLYWQNYTNTGRARRAPNKHYEIPFVRSMPCSNYTLRNAVRCSSLRGGLYWQNYTNIGRARRAPNKHYEIPFVRSMPCSNYTLRNAVRRSSLCGALTDQITQIQEEHDMFRSKPNHCISLRRNMSCSSLYLAKTATRLHSLTSNDPRGCIA